MEEERSRVEAARAAEEEHKRRQEEWQRREQQHRVELAEKARNREYLLSLSPRDFEHHTAQLFQALGYIVRTTPASNDFGVDIYLEKDGRKAIVQCKHFTRGNVSRPDLQQFYGVLMHEQADKGFFVTTGGFTTGAADWIRNKPIDLINIDRLIELARGAYTEEHLRMDRSVES